MPSEPGVSRVSARMRNPARVAWRASGARRLSAPSRSRGEKRSGVEADFESRAGRAPTVRLIAAILRGSASGRRFALARLLRFFFLVLRFLDQAERQPARGAR